MFKFSYEIALNNKNLMDQGKRNPEITDIVGLKRSQLTSYKKNY